MIFWKDQGNCLNTPDADIFFPETFEQEIRAKSICLDCPVKKLCSDLADSNKEKFGVWGGELRGEREYNAGEVLF